MTIDGYDEDELKQAVEKSKHDYFQLKQKEDQQELKEAEEDEFDLGPSILFTDSSTLHKDPGPVVNLLVLVRLFYSILMTIARVKLRSRKTIKYLNQRIVMKNCLL